MSQKSIKKILKSQKVDMGGHLLDQPLPHPAVDSIDPFLLIHHWIDEMPGGERQQDVGVGPHPHRGFSPVTYIYKGDIQHKDSLGNNEVVEEGGTQWMFSGKGIIHSERPSKKMAEVGGDIEFIQFWINTPAKNKMEPPFYKPISKENTPTITHEDATIQVICGEYEGLKGSVNNHSPLTLLRIELKENCSIELSLDDSFNTIIYQLDGNMEINSQPTKGKEMIWFNNDGDFINIKSSDATRFIVLSGKPIEESIVSYGPFVMNTQREIMEALRDSQTGKMGKLIEEF